MGGAVGGGKTTGPGTDIFHLGRFYSFPNRPAFSFTRRDPVAGGRYGSCEKGKGQFERVEPASVGQWGGLKQSFSEKKQIGRNSE